MRPVLFSLGGYDVLTSPFVTILGASAAFFYFRRYRGWARLTLERFWALVLLLLVGAFAGAILVYFLFYGGGPSGNLRYLKANHVTPGGSLYGAFWVGVLSAYAFCRSTGTDFRRLADILGGMAPLGLVVKRWGCFLQGCCYGIPTALPWGAVFSDPRCRVPRAWLGVPLHPVQLYESLAAVPIFLFVHSHVFRRVRQGRLAAGSAFIASAALYSAVRFCLESFRGGDDGLLRLGGLDTSRLFALASLAAAAVLRRRWRLRDA